MNNNCCLTFPLFVNAVFSNNYWIWLLYDMKNYNNADQGGCYPLIQKTKVDNKLQDMCNSFCVIKTELNVYKSFKI